MASEDMAFIGSPLLPEAAPSVAEGDFVGLFRHQGLDHLTQKILLLLISAKRMKCNLGEVKLVSRTWREAADNLVLSTRVGKDTYLHRIKEVIRRHVSEIEEKELDRICYTRNVYLRGYRTWMSREGLSRVRRFKVHRHLPAAILALRSLVDGKKGLRALHKWVSSQMQLHTVESHDEARWSQLLWQDAPIIWKLRAARWQNMPDWWRDGVKIAESDGTRLVDIDRLLSIVRGKVDLESRKRALEWKEMIMRTPFPKAIARQGRYVWRDEKMFWKHAIKSLLVYHLHTN